MCKISKVNNVRLPLIKLSWGGQTQQISTINVTTVPLMREIHMDTGDFDEDIMEVNRDS